MTNDSPTGGAIPASVPTIDPKAAPTLQHAEAEIFYTEAIRELAATDIPFLVAGTYAVSAYTGVTRQTKDLDIFCKAGDYARILAHFKQAGYAVEIVDDRWLGKVFKSTHFFDVIFASANGTMPVGDGWLEHARQIELLGSQVRIVGPTELIWSKCFIQDRGRHRSHHPQGAGSDRLAPAAFLPRSPLGGAADAASEFSMDLSERARSHSRLAARRIA
jgi:hypothetical protein